jgi:hypothetical protein
MPIVLRQRGFEVAIRPRDHSPPHVHVLYGSEEVVILLGGDDDPQVRENRGMSRRNIRRAIDIVTANNDVCLREWRKIHG